MKTDNITVERIVMTTIDESYLAARACAQAIVNYHKQIGHNRSFIMGEIDRATHRWTVSIYIGNDTHINMFVVANFGDQLTITGMDPDGIIRPSTLSPLMLNSIICEEILGSPEIPAPSRRSISEAHEAAVVTVHAELDAAMKSGNIDMKFFARDDEAEVWDDIVSIAWIDHPFSDMVVNNVPSYLVDVFQDVYYEAASEAIGAKCDQARRLQDLAAS